MKPVLAFSVAALAAMLLAKQASSLPLATGSIDIAESEPVRLRRQGESLGPVVCPRVNCCVY